MKATSRDVNGVEIVKLEGKITIGAGDSQLREVISNALAAGKSKILLDMSGVTTIDSSGIGELVGSYTTVTNRGGKLKLLHLPAKLNELLHVTQLITVFGWTPSCSAASGRRSVFGLAGAAVAILSSLVYLHSSAYVRYVKNIPFIGYVAYVLNSVFMRQHAAFSTSSLHLPRVAQTVSPF